MAKRVFFSFHYQDVSDFRANVVRNCWVTHLDRGSAGFFDASVWETAKRTNPTAVKRLINSELEGTSTTCVLIGSATYARPWVRYEILQSFRRGNSILGVRINAIPAKDGTTKLNGPNPLSCVGVTFAVAGDIATLWQHAGGRWEEYIEIDGSATYRLAGLAPAYMRGHGYNLGQLYPTYDWANDGYHQFATWVG